VYHTYIRSDICTRLDTALLAATRAFDVPALITEDGKRIESSTVLVLAALQSARGPLPIGRLAASLGVAHSTASRLVSRAADAGMVERTSSTADQRQQLVEATPSGRALAERAQQFRVARLGEFTAGWPADDIEHLATLLARLTTTASKSAPPTSGTDPAIRRSTGLKSGRN